MIDCPVYDNGAWIDDIVAAKPVCAEIRHVRGGTVSALLQAVDSRTRFRIDGKCVSACAWLVFLSPGTCFTRRSEFWVHGAVDVLTGRHLPLMTEQLLQHLPPQLRNRLGSGRRMVRLSAAEMASHAPGRICGASTS